MIPRGGVGNLFGPEILSLFRPELRELCVCVCVCVLSRGILYRADSGRVILTIFTHQYVTTHTVL